MKRIAPIYLFGLCVSVLSACGGDSSTPAAAAGSLNDGSSAIKLSTPLAESKFVVLNEGDSFDANRSGGQRVLVIASQSQYAAELTKYTDVTPANVDFSKGKVLFVDMGGKPTGGHSVRVASVDVASNEVVANIEFTSPGEACIVTQAITNPYQFVFIPTLKEIRTAEKMVVTNCQL